MLPSLLACPSLPPHPKNPSSSIPPFTHNYRWPPLVSLSLPIPRSSPAAVLHCPSLPPTSPHYTSAVFPSNRSAVCAEGRYSNSFGVTAVDLASLSTQQLSQVKKQLDDELQHLTASFQSLRAAQLKFRDCIKSLATGLQKQGSGGDAGAAKPKPILVPLTSSLYVPGTLAATDRVLVDVGTGFYVEKRIPAAEAFYRRKIADLEANLKDLEKIVQGKTNNVRVVEEGASSRLVLPPFFLSCFFLFYNQTSRVGVRLFCGWLARLLIAHPHIYTLAPHITPKLPTP